MNQHFTSFQAFKQRYPIQFGERAMWLGSGSFGKVLKVEDQVETEWVAIKISEYRGNDDKSLRAEVELAQKVPRHANIARYDTCYRLETDTGVNDFAVMKYYADGNLADFMKRGDLDNERLYDVTKGILLGLKHLHQHRIIHRDFKPANILISRDNKGRFIPKIADFGLSKLVSEEEIESSDFDLSDGRGTPSYKAPEQIEGGRVSFNLDLWAFGVILYEMVTGDRPFGLGGQTLSEPTLKRDIERRIVLGQLPERINTVPEPYQAIIRRCLVKDIHKRVRKADELISLLEQKIKIEESFIKKTVAVAGRPDYTDVFSPANTPIAGNSTDVFEESKPVGLVDKEHTSKNTHWIFWGGGASVMGILLFIWLWPKSEQLKTPVSDSLMTTIPVKIVNKEKSAPRLSHTKLKTDNSRTKPQTVDIQKIQPAAQGYIETEREREAQTLKKKLEAQGKYDGLIEKGIIAINSNNNKSAAISYFTEAGQLAAENNLITEKATSAYTIYLAKANRIFESEEYEGAKGWYKVAQSLINNQVVRQKIKECDNNL